MNDQIMPWALTAAIFTAMIVIGSKMFDYYHNRTANDLKLYLDIEKGIRENSHEKESIDFFRKIVKSKISDLEIEQKTVNFRKEHHPKLDKNYKKAREIGLFLLPLSGLFLFIAMTIIIASGRIEIFSWFASFFLLIICVVISKYLDAIDNRLEKEQNPTCSDNCLTHSHGQTNAL